MKLLLTSPPGLGKSTIIDSIVESIDCHKFGIVAREVLDQDGLRSGFRAIDSKGNQRQFMSATKDGSGPINGFAVDLEAIDAFVVPELEKALEQTETFVYIDEIGRAQARSKAFIDVVRRIFASSNPMLASIVFADEPFSLEFKNHPQAVSIEVNLKNRDRLPDVLRAALSNYSLYAGLSQARRLFVRQRFGSLIERDKLVSARKLFDNAIHYLVFDKVARSPANENEYEVRGKTDVHKLTLGNSDEEFTCDCDLANGRGQFVGRREPCSHYFSAILKRLS